MVDESSQSFSMEYKFTDETRRRMSEAKQRFFANGGNPWNKMSDSDAMKKCVKCGQVFRVTSRKRIQTAKFCSIECGKGYHIFSKGFTPWNKGKPHLRGAKHWNWKGGIDKEHTRIKQTQEYKDWQQIVYRKGKWKCKKCGYKGKLIVAHHLKPFSTFPKLRFKVSNGMVLCRPCHQDVHRPRRKNYQSQPIYAS